ncbi:ribonuclease R, partial [bacterium]|nr:ribonuclease R [bacterium]
MDLSPERLLSEFQSRPGESISVYDLIDRIGAAPHHRRMIQQVLLSLVKQGKLVRLKGKRFLYSKGGKHATGKLHVSRAGAGFLLGAGDRLPSVESNDLYIHKTNLGTALDGDTVEVEVLPGPKGKLEGRVLEVLERAHDHVVGQFKRVGKGGNVTPRNLRIGRWIEVPSAPPPTELADGAWVRVHVTRWSDDPCDPLEAEIEEVLGMPGERGISVLVLLRDMGVELEFPPEVLRQAEQFEASISDVEMQYRRDLRDLPICTIDPATAKDFDDALSIEKLDSENWWLGVHIADVSQYVKNAKPIDQEALARGTSIYPVDRVVPMLPERLSNDLCSLRPDEDRYAMTCFMEIDRRGQVVRHEVCESVIRSRNRLSYQEVQEYFDSPDRRAEFPFHGMENELLELRQLARTLTRMRMERGALDLDLPETKVVCNEEGDVLDVKRHERLESHRLVEECMLIANETVAEHMKRKGLPLLYRIHDQPDPNALMRIAPTLEMYGIKMPKKKNIEADSAFYQSIIERLHGKDGGHIPQRMLLSTLMRAEYSPENKGHFGLASKCYCHFTSPIRRYPDLLTHRVLKDSFRGKIDEAYKEEAKNSLSEIASQSNDTGREAERIERQAVDIKSMEFMADQVGGVFDGWISNISRRGFHVELVEVPVEGFVSSRYIQGDSYGPDENFTRLVGRYTRRAFRLGQRIKVQIAQVSVVEGEMDLMLVEKGTRPGDTKKSRARHKKEKSRRG